MEQGRNAGENGAAHVAGNRLILFAREITVHGVPHLRSRRKPRRSIPASLTWGSGSARTPGIAQLLAMASRP